MSTNWGASGTSTFVPTSHSQPKESINPTNVSLPKPFVVCVVGASRGIGAGVATSYAHAGCSGLLLASRRVSGLEETAEVCRKIHAGVQVEIVACDITIAGNVERLENVVREKFGGRLDVVVVNSGYSGPVVLRIHETDVETFRRASDVNYVGTFHCAKYLIPLLLSTPANGKNQSFIIVSSLAAAIVRGPIANAQYCVSKAAQLKLLENIHEQYHREGLKAWAVHPGAVLSEMADETTPDAFRPYLTDSAELCGAFCVWLTEGGEKRKWLCGRLVSAKWDPEELEGKREEVGEGDLLKMKLAV